MSGPAGGPAGGPPRNAAGLRVACGTCPWRRSTATEAIPGGGMDHLRAQAVRGEGWTVMACHLTPDEAPVACAGFIAAERAGGCRNIGLRLAVIQGWVSLDEYADPEPGTLWPTTEAMLAAHPPRGRGPARDDRARGSRPGRPERDRKES